MPNDRRSPAPRRSQDRLDDHAAIDHLADDLLPALVAKLGASGLGELEIREGTWRVRLRMPGDGSAVAGRRPVPGRGGSRTGDGPHAERARADGTGAADTGTVPGSPGPATESAPAVGPSRVVATSPAVGYFRPRGDLRAGTKVRAGDRIGSVDVLGIGQDLVAPGDGLIGATLVAPGEPVEYGQAIIVLEQLAEPRPQPGHVGSVPAEGTPDETGVAARPAPPDALPVDRDTPPDIGPADREANPTFLDVTEPAGADGGSPDASADAATPADAGDLDADPPDGAPPTGAT